MHAVTHNGFNRIGLEWEISQGERHTAVKFNTFLLNETLCVSCYQWFLSRGNKKTENTKEHAVTFSPKETTSVHHRILSQSSKHSWVSSQLCLCVMAKFTILDCAFSWWAHVSMITVGLLHYLTQLTSLVWLLKHTALQSTLFSFLSFLSVIAQACMSKHIIDLKIYSLFILWYVRPDPVLIFSLPLKLVKLFIWS